MKNVSVTTLAILSIMLAGLSCRLMDRRVQGSGIRKTEKRAVGAYKSIETSGAFEIAITCQQGQSFEIEGDDNILPLIKTEVRDGVLHIDTEKDYRSTKATAVRISIPDLEKFSSTGAGDVHIKDVKNDKLGLSSTGAANFEASGQSKFVEVGSTGAGNIDTSKLIAERARVTVSGAANVDVYASQQLDVSVSGVGSVTYSGNPPVVNKSVSGIGSVSKKD